MLSPQLSPEMYTTLYNGKFSRGRGEIFTKLTVDLVPQIFVKSLCVALTYDATM